MNIRRVLIIIGALVLVAGIAWPWLSRLALGHLPGDIVVKKGHVVFYFPIVTSIIVSAVVTLLLWLFRK